MTGVRDANEPDDLLTWALAEMERLEAIPESDPRYGIAGELIAFWSRRITQLMDEAVDD